MWSILGWAVTRNNTFIIPQTICSWLKTGSVLFRAFCVRMTTTEKHGSYKKAACEPHLLGGSWGWSLTGHILLCFWTAGRASVGLGPEILTEWKFLNKNTRIYAEACFQSGDSRAWPVYCVGWAHGVVWCWSATSLSASCHQTWTPSTSVLLHTPTKVQRTGSVCSQ